jgi:hypothetical protein
MLSLISHPSLPNKDLTVGRETVLVGRMIGVYFRGDIHDDRFFLADTLPSMVNLRGYLNKDGVVDPDEELVDLSRRITRGSEGSDVPGPPRCCRSGP